MKRSRTDIDAGIGYIVIAGGTKPFEQIKNKNVSMLLVLGIKHMLN